MAKAGQLEFSLVPVSLNAGLKEEIASFGKLAIVANGRVLTEGVGLDSNELKDGPYVSGYHLAVWLVHNWWRLLWEPSLDGVDRASRGWDFAHWMSSIGEGFVWPNMELVSDGHRMTLESSPSIDIHAKAFRYLGSPRIKIVDIEEFEIAAGDLVVRVLEMLDHECLRDTGLHRIWQTWNSRRTTRRSLPSAVLKP